MPDFRRIIFCVYTCLLWLGSAFVQAETSSALPGGSATVHRTDSNAFSMPSANMAMTRKLDFNVGNSFFRNPWVVAPASTTARDGLGPLFNTNGCQSCHIKDGRGHAPEHGDDSAVSLLIRLSIPPQNTDDQALLLNQGVIPEPTYGGQLQDFAMQGIAAEGRVRVQWQEDVFEFADGSTQALRRPVWQITDLGYGPMHPQVMMSARVAPPMIGLGLLEAIPESALMALADPDDQNGDGISGKANKVWDVRAGETTLGRFGWKAGMPNLMQQNAGAFNGDLGLTSHLYPQDDCREAQMDCRNAPNGGEYEVSPNILKFVEFYSRNLAVPARRNTVSPQVQQGEWLFKSSGCTACHQPMFKTAELPEQPEQSGQTIWPYTDLLLHDMGEDLADHRPEFEASGREWRTPPLWGIGLNPTVAGHSQLLHDGRARNTLEAILWHGGEAANARERVRQLSKDDREALVAFVNSL